MKLKKDIVKEIAGLAWSAAANAHRMYPDSKHPFSTHWAGSSELYSRFIESAPTPPTRSAEELYEDKTYHSRIEHIKAYIKKWLLDMEDLPKDGNLPSQLWIGDVTELIDTYASQFRHEVTDEEIERETIDDGFGNSRNKYCGICGGEMYVNRPGDFRCKKCY